MRRTELNLCLFGRKIKLNKNISMQTLLSVKWQPGWEGRLGENGSMCMCGWVPLLSAWNCHSVVHLLFVVLVGSSSPLQLVATPRTAAHLVSLSLTITRRLRTFTSTDSAMPSRHFILSCPLLFFAVSLAQHQGLFPQVGSSHQVVKGLELQLQHRSFQWILRVDFL